MSDLSGSIVEESSESFSADSLEFSEKKSLKPAALSFLRENKTLKDDFPSNNCSQSDGTHDKLNLIKRKIVFPRIDNHFGDKGSKILPLSLNLNIDNEDLNKRGLHLNSDGSFIKSPRSEDEELPFVNPKLKNIFLQMKKPVETKRKAFCVKRNRKNTFTFKEDNVVDEISMSEIINARVKKDSSEEVLISTGGSVNNFARSNGKPKYSLSCSEYSSLRNSTRQVVPPEKHKTSVKLPNHLKRTKSVTSLLETAVSERNQNSETSRPFLKLPAVHGKLINLEEEALTQSMSKIEITRNRRDKNPIDILLDKQAKTTEKLRLSYAERRQKEQGYNPLFLRLGVKNFPTDTCRSNFGDSTSCRFSDTSSRIYSNRNDDSDEEDEESFYRRLIEKEKMGIQRSSRSETPLFMKEYAGSNFCKDQIQLKSTSAKKQVIKKPNKSMSIDLPQDCHKTRPSKTNHYCSSNTPSSISKAELAQKAKAYGILVNARNVFRIKNQAAKRQSMAAYENGSNFSVRRTMSSLRTKNSTNKESVCRKQASFDNSVCRGKCAELEPEQSSKIKRTCKSEIVKTDSEAGSFVALNNFLEKEEKENKMRREILKRMRSCIKQDISY